MAKKLVEENNKTDQLPSYKEIANETGVNIYTVPNIIKALKGIIYREKMEKLIQEANTGRIEGITPVCSVHDKPRKRRNE